jgi:hypothetical protein
MLEASDLLVTLCVTLAFVSLPALLALYSNSRPSENGLDWVHTSDCWRWE